MKKALIAVSFVASFFGQFHIAIVCVILGMIGGVLNERHNEA